jgi:outer membrane protein OmpA-like peptidoglycan-associated protein
MSYLSFRNFCLTLLVLLGSVSTSDANVNVQTFEPAEDGGAFVSTYDTRVLPAGTLRAGAYLNTAYKPLIRIDGVTGEESAAVRQLWTFDTLLALGIMENVHVGLALPFHPYVTGDQSAAGPDLSSSYPGDLRIMAKVALTPSLNLPFQLALVPWLTLPTGNSDRFMGHDGVTGGGRLVFDTELPPVWERTTTLGANLGMAAQGAAQLGDEEIGNLFDYALALRTPVNPVLDWILEVHGQASASRPIANQAANLMELQMAGRVRAGEDDEGMAFTFGLGRGLTKGVGSPVVRVFAGAMIGFPVWGRTPEAPPVFHMRGRVLDSVGGQPIRAWAQVPGIDTRGTEPDGTFSFALPVVKSYALTITAEGYQDWTGEGALFAESGESIPIVSMVRIPALLAGRLTDSETGAPIDGWVSADAQRVSTKAGAFGMSFPGELTGATIAARVAGYRTATTQVSLASGMTTQLTLPLRPFVRDIQIKGSIIDAESKEPLAADVFWKGQSLAKEERGNSSFAITLRSDATGTFLAKASGYEEVEVPFVAPDEGGQLEVRITLPRQKIVVQDRRLVVDPIFFDSAKATIQARSLPVLQQIARYLTEHGDLKMHIEGHSDNVGREAFNVRLSQDRVDSVIDYLASQGIERKRLTAEGFGPRKPIAPNDTEEGRAANRRVEFIIVDEVFEEALESGEAQGSDGAPPTLKAMEPQETQKE